MTVGELLEKMDFSELIEWLAYSQINPFGEEREDYRMGVIASAIYNNNANRTKQSKIFQPSDFFPQFEKIEKPKQSIQTQLQIVEILNIAFGGVDNRGK